MLLSGMHDRRFLNDTLQGAWRLAGWVLAFLMTPARSFVQAPTQRGICNDGVCLVYTSRE